MTITAPDVGPDGILDRRYRILGPIADGGMGTVFLAQHVLMKRRFAIKFLHRELASDLGMVRRFMDEAFAAGTLGHPHIVEATDMGFSPDHVPYIVFEYLQGATLAAELRRHGAMSVRRALTIATQIASALERAHAAGIVHLDLKADNVFLTDTPNLRDHVKVLDFGIARVLDPGTDPPREHRIEGTPEYMAPEQMRDPDGVDKRADVYALGVVLYEMLAGRRPFAETDARVLMWRVLHDAPPPIARDAVPPELEQLIVERMLAKAPARRLASMCEVEAALRPLLSRAARVRGSSPVIPVLPELAAAPTQRALAPRDPPQLNDALRMTLERASRPGNRTG